MSSSFDFNPERVIRHKKFVVPNGEIMGVLYENNDGKYVISFLKNMEIFKEIDVTDKWLNSKSVHEIDTFMNTFISHIAKNNPW